MSDGFTCFVCGYPDLSEPPWQDMSPSYEICPSCGTEFGFDDEFGAEDAHRRLREAWIARGMTWWSNGRPAPPGWDPAAQVRAVSE